MRAMEVLCVIGDVVGSRHIGDRQEFQRRLQSAMNQVNRRARHLLSPYTLTLGDEFQSLYDGAESLFRDLVNVQEKTFPERIRFSIGVGSLTTPVNRRRAIGMDGPAFHASREGIGIMKNSTALFRVSGAGESGQSWINPALELISHETRNWKQSRF
ncbi:MAG: hypothetical protein FJW35_03420, partial [Acidobacteria bacterium]|nr:hypothetical protein [Acidobacteriota bacterium]